ncbi:RICIN domain-containing protein [Dactylosporangium sp. AC04546]|uniref:RICIN domain-containing protein n=1 Tax=Dactylosporangium sp. AC04546 TaxID=2862460 RepID=UPI001EE07172|nr:RICIN domain-containing protein [Dactylosporangium sp. AC04546]WVK79018.1 RICIN domain-containing protein [Dactylosporangium sp. AC04546]
MSRTNALTYLDGEVDFRRRLLAWLAAVLTTLAAVTIMVVAGAPKAHAAPGFDPSQFRGVHWSRLGDNFTADRLVLQGLSASDDYNTTRSKADAMFAAFQSDLGANTVRLPINPATTAWTAYNGVIDAATARGFRVILCYWVQDGTNMVPPSFVPTFNQMWDTLAARYLSNPLVYFDPVNEPIGFTTPQWLDFAAAWVARMNAAGIPGNRLFVEGAQLDGGGWGSDLRPLCNDARFNGVYLGMHRYAFPYGSRTYEQWVTDITTLMGNCAARTVIEEFGASADTGVDFNAAPTATSDKEVAYLRAITDVARNYHLGAIWCHVIGGRTTSPDHDTLNILRLAGGFDGSTANLPLWTPNPSAVDRLKYAWGALGSGTTELRNVGFNACLEVPGSSQANDVQTAARSCANGANQRWTRQANGTITVYNGTKCLDAFGFGKTNGTRVVIHDCLGNANQRWRFFSDGTIRGVDSRLCLDADLANPQNVQLWSCGGGNNQKWRRFGSPVGLRSYANGQIVAAESAGAQPLIADRPAVDPWERFDVVDNPDGSVSLRAQANNRYVSAPNGGASPLIADSTTIGPAQTFDLIYNPDGSLSFRARVNGRIVAAESAGAQPLIANRTAVGTWEKFDLLV